jgi:PAS domain S-box-containing protein
VFVVAYAVIQRENSTAAFEPRWLLPTLNVLLLTGVPFLVAALSARSFLAGESAPVLLLGCGMLAFGIACAFAAITVAVGLRANATVTVHNLGSCIGALCCLLGAALAAGQVDAGGSPEHAVRTATAAYLAVAVGVCLISVAAFDNLLPPFFVAGGGPTPLRQGVLGAAIVMFGVSAIIFLALNARLPSAFLSWYGLALLLIALGLVGLFAQHTLGSPMNWLGRGAQYVGCIYMLLAVLSVPSSIRPRGIPLDRILRETSDRYRRLIELSPDAILVHSQGRYVFANPAAAQLFGATSPQDLLQRKALALVHPDDRGTVTNRLERGLAGAAADVRELRILRLDGTSVEVEVTVAGVEYAGEPATQIVVRDVTERKRATAALQEALARAEESQRTLSALLEHVPAGITISDASGTIELVSRHGRELLGGLHEGLTIEAVADRWKVFHADGVTPMATDDIPLTRAMRKGEVVRNQELVQVNAEGHPVPLLCNAAPILDGGGRITGGVVAWLDITARMQAEQALRMSERLHRAIGEAIDYGIWVCAPDGNNTYASESFLRLVGMTQDQCSNLGWAEALHPDDAASTLETWTTCVRTEDVWDHEHRFRGVDGRWHPILARGAPVRDEKGGILCWAGINLDIGRLKEAEEALRQADRRKGEFLATLSHELRNPLAPIRYALALMGREHPSGAEPTRVIERQLSHLVHLVDDLLDITRIANNKIQLRTGPIDLAAAVQHAVESATPDIVAAGHTLTVAPPLETVWVEADFDRLAQVFTNLLNNAARYTPRGGCIGLSVRPGRDEVVVSVTDTGVGLRAEDLARVFDMFTQLGEAGHGGLGIGLAIVKGLVELHGGTVEARSSGPGQGSEFLVRLPRAPAPMLPDAPALDTAGVSPLKVLVVDDNVDSTEMMRMLLETRGHRVRVAHDAYSALEVLAEFDPEVGLFDIGLPGMSGYELARVVRSKPRHSGMLLVAVTGWGQDEDRQRALAHGFDEHLTKPADPDELGRLLTHARPAKI